MKKMKYIALTALLAVSINTMASARRGFAIVVDPKSYVEAKADIDAYAKAVEEVNGLKVYILQDKWGVPDSIRQHLIQLHQLKKEPIEGAILLGDIPVPMIRDAQHLTSAFKMSQKSDRKESSVPSDRFYDDFGMKFNYLDKDEDAPYFYYSLAADSRQYLATSIYTGRVRPTDVNGTSRYEKLRAFLRKAVAEKRASRQLNQMFYFNGNGYISESLMARIDEKQGLYEHFPWLHRQQNGINYFSHTQSDVSKFNLMNELQRLDLDFAILHHHGDPDTQYLDGIAAINMPSKAKDFITEYCRNYLREWITDETTQAEKDSLIQDVLDHLDIPRSWIDNTWDKDIMAMDSTNAANDNLILDDFQVYHYQPNCRFVIIDACFTGSFHLDDCIANEYIFSAGKTVAVLANSVNTLQDKWSDRYMGLVGLGANVGHLARYSSYLETQCIGDPTFHFTPAAKTADVNALLAANDSRVWKKYLTDETYPDLTCTAIMLQQLEGKSDAKYLLDRLANSQSAMVRMQALLSLQEMGGENAIKAIRIGLNDSYELVQRYAVNFLDKNGDPRLIPDLIKIAIAPNSSERVTYNAMNAMSKFPEDALMQEFARQFDNDSIKYINKAEVREQIASTIKNYAERWTPYVDNVCNEEASVAARQQSTRAMRNYGPSFQSERLMQAFDKMTDVELQTMLLEALGWRNYAYTAPQVATFAKKVSEDPRYDAQVRQEALKTYNRVKK